MVSITFSSWASIIDFKNNALQRCTICPSLFGYQVGVGRVCVYVNIITNILFLIDIFHGPTYPLIAMFNTTEQQWKSPFPRLPCVVSSESVVSSMVVDGQGDLFVVYYCATPEYVHVLFFDIYSLIWFSIKF